MDGLERNVGVPRGPGGPPHIVLGGLPGDKPVSVSRPFGRAAVIPLGRRSLSGSSNLPGSRNGAGRSCSPIWSCSAWGLPCQRPLPEPRCALTAPFHPYLAGIAPRPAVLFSVVLSVKLALSESPRPLAGMPPYGDRTFLPPNRLAALERATACLAGPSPLCYAEKSRARATAGIETLFGSGASQGCSCILEVASHCFQGGIWGVGRVVKKEQPEGHACRWTPPEKIEYFFRYCGFQEGQRDVS